MRQNRNISYQSDQSFYRSNNHHFKKKLHTKSMDCLPQCLIHNSTKFQLNAISSWNKIIKISKLVSIRQVVYQL